MTKVGRNQKCPCDSGLKYKHCHGHPVTGSPLYEGPAFDMVSNMRSKHEAAELIRKQQQGAGRPIISVKSQGHQLVAVGNRLHYSPHWNYFTDFLTDYLKNLLGPVWENAELKNETKNRHPILQWYQAYREQQQRENTKVNGAYKMAHTGASYCYLGLAYNLYLIKHNVELQDLLVQRIKEASLFQGAYYELIAANCLIRAGFELELEDEEDDTQKHCEFSAFSPATGKKYWIEVKAKGIRGLLGKTKLDGSSSTTKPTSSLNRHLKEALAKPAPDERIVFIDVNTVLMNEDQIENSQPPDWVSAAKKQLNQIECNFRSDESAYLFITNMSFHRQLNGNPKGHSAFAFGFNIDDFGKSGHFQLSEIWRREQKHKDIHKIADALLSYPNIPNRFDGKLPLTEQSEDNRIIIGETYHFDDIGGQAGLGTVTTATVSIGEKKAYFGVQTQDDKGVILTKALSDEEIEAYNAHPEGYFGAVKQAQKKVDDPYELFKWLLNSYQNTSKEKLLELMSSGPNIDQFRDMDQEELALMYCEGMAANIINSSNNEDVTSPSSTPPKT